MSDTSKEIIKEVNRRKAGITSGIIAIVFAVLGIFTLGFIFVPLAAIIALFGTINAIGHNNWAGFGIQIIAWGCIFVGAMTSPFLLSLFVVT